MENFGEKIIFTRPAEKDEKTEENKIITEDEKDIETCLQCKKGDDWQSCQDCEYSGGINKNSVKEDYPRPPHVENRGPYQPKK